MEEQVHTLTRQRDSLNSKLAKCAEVAQEMEEYYLGQIGALKGTIAEQ